MLVARLLSTRKRLRDCERVGMQFLASLKSADALIRYFCMSCHFREREIKDEESMNVAGATELTKIE